jgi:hypothetical protein
MDQLFESIRDALDVGTKILGAPESELVALTDQRHRLLKRSDTLTKEALPGFQRFFHDPNLNPKERAFLSEKQKRLLDLEPVILRQNYKLESSLGNRVKDTRTELAQHNRATHAISAYIKAPRPKPIIS